MCGGSRSPPGARTDPAEVGSNGPELPEGRGVSPGRRMVDDERAFAERVSAHAGAVARFARRLTGNHADAEDAVQETMIRALERRGELRDAERLRPWLLAIARTTCLNARRGLRQELEVLDG